MHRSGLVLAWLCLPLTVGPARRGSAEEPWRFIRPEQRQIQVRDPSMLPRAHIPAVPRPPTVSDPQKDAEPRLISLDAAIRTALANSEVVRVLAGVTAASSGSTIYDPAVSNTAVDEARARFDPTLEVQNSFSRTEQPEASFDPMDPARAVIDGVTRDNYNLDLALTKVTSTGATASLRVNADRTRSRTELLPLNPQTASSIELGLTQPLLQGGGVRANLAPIVIARINVERSYFQFKGSMQQSVRGVIQAYWSLVFARTDAWARQRQVEQGEEALRRADARLRSGLVDIAEVSQARSALANFRAGLIASQAGVIDQEAALRNMLGLPPSDSGPLVPVTPPAPDRMDVDWDGIIRLAEEHRPDLIELKLIIEADEQALLQAQNQAQPKLDAVMLYRWNGLEGTMPSGSEISTRGGQFTDWTLGINFAVPLGLRQGRAALRRQELIIERDRANLDQGLHNATHQLALSLRNLDENYEQYVAFQEARLAARQNLERQLENYRRGRAVLLNVLQAITDWGNAVSAESQALTRYNTELASLEQETGTLLETHGITFYEERYCSAGPLGRLGRGRLYPAAVRPGPNDDRYPVTTEPAENLFDLEDPLKPQAPRPPEPGPAIEPASGIEAPVRAEPAAGPANPPRTILGRAGQLLRRVRRSAPE